MGALLLIFFYFIPTLVFMFLPARQLNLSATQKFPTFFYPIQPKISHILVYVPLQFQVFLANV